MPTAVAQEYSSGERMHATKHAKEMASCASCTAIKSNAYRGNILLWHQHANVLYSVDTIIPYLNLYYIIWLGRYSLTSDWPTPRTPQDAGIFGDGRHCIVPVRVLQQFCVKTYYARSGRHPNPRKTWKKQYLAPKTALCSAYISHTTKWFWLIVVGSMYARTSKMMLLSVSDRSNKQMREC